MKEMSGVFSFSLFVIHLCALLFHTVNILTQSVKFFWCWNNLYTGYAVNSQLSKDKHTDKQVQVRISTLIDQFILKDYTTQALFSNLTLTPFMY